MEPRYYVVVKAGANPLICPKCGGISKVQGRKPGIQKAIENCPFCKAKIEATYEPEPGERKESGRLDSIIREDLAGLSGQDREAYKAGLWKMGYPDPDLVASFQRMGLSVKEAKIAARGR